MTQEVCQQIANLLGQRPLSELPFGDNSPVTGEYVVYKQGNSNIYRIASTDIYTYFCRKVFWFVFDEMNPQPEDGFSCIVLNPQRYIQPGDTPITYARRLLDVVNNPNEEWTGRWIGDPAPSGAGTNISQEWFKHFQYYYFDNLNNRQRTMLLTTAPGEYKEKTFDILIWLDASGSMWNEIHDLADGIYDLGQLIFAQNPNNRISIVMFRCGGYWETHDTYASWTKENAVHLPFTSYDNGLGLQRIDTYIHKLADWFENNGAVFDENVWFLNKLAYDNYHFTPREQEKLADFDTTWSKTGWDVGWRKQEDCTCPLTKMIVAISDEIADPYISITGNVAAAYKKGTQFPEQLRVNVQGENWTWNGPTPDKKVDNIDDVLSGNCDWLFIPRSMFYVYRSWDNKHWEYDPYCGKEKEEDKVNGKWVHQYYPGFCDYTTRWPDRCPNNGGANSGALGKYENHYGYDPSVHTMDKFFKAFKDNDVQFRFLYTGAPAMNINVFDRREFEICRLYIYRWQQDIISRMYDAEKNKQFGFLHLIEQTQVAETLADIFRNEVIEGLACPWSNDMWYSHLEETTTQTLPGVWKNPQEYTHLVVPKTAIVADSSKRTGHEFQKRNYTKIVTGGWTPGNTKDESWAAVSNATVEPSPEVNDDIYDGRGELVARNIGDIDQTIKVIGEFLDDVMFSIKPMEHTGQVVFTASTDRSPLGMGWKNLISSDSDNESFVWSGNDSLKGENTNLVPGIPNHHHNTVFNGSNAMPIQNVSVVGRPEGETVGGVAKVDTAERLPTASYGKKEDTVHRLSNPGPALSGRGAYNGTVEYDAYEVGATQQAHNNMPLYYKMRAFVHD